MKLIRLATIAALSNYNLSRRRNWRFCRGRRKNEVRNVDTYGHIEFTTTSTDEELVVVPPEQGPDVSFQPKYQKQPVLYLSLKQHI